jgi:type I restriction enzyme M protein
LAFLLFLKIADEQSRPPLNKQSPIPKEFDWQSLLNRDGHELETHYRHILESPGKEKDMLGVLPVNLESRSEGSRMFTAIEDAEEAGV